MIQKSRISHRYRKTMLTEFIQDMKHTLLDDEFLKQISNKKQLEAFYIAAIKMCAADHKYYGFMNLSLLSEIPEQLEISLKTLLLAHINTDAVINGCKTDKGKYLYYKSLGKYLLIHIDQLTEVIEGSDPCPGSRITP